MDLITNYFDLEKKINENEINLYIECDDLLNQIYCEYLDTQIIEEDEKNLLEKYIPHYTTNIKCLGLFFSVDFILCHRHNNIKPKLKKKIEIECEDIKLKLPKMYEYVKNNFLKKVSSLMELRIRSEISTKYQNLFNEMKLTYENKDTYATNLYKWYWNNKLFSISNIHNLQLLLSENKIFVETTEKALYSIFLFPDYNIKFIAEQVDLFEFENTDYLIKFKPFNMYPNGYTPKYIFTIISKLTNQNFCITNFSHHLRMNIDDIFNDIINFVLMYASKIHFR